MGTKAVSTRVSANIAEMLPDYLAAVVPRKTTVSIPKGEVIFSQGDPAETVFYVQKGCVKLSVTSPQGKGATLALQGAGGFIGEECVASSHSFRLTAATAFLPCTLLRVDVKDMLKVLDSDRRVVQLFQSFLLGRCLSMQAELIDHLCNSSEKRLARTLLSLAQFGGGAEATVTHVTQEDLASMIGTTRSRVSFFMNRFREMGYVSYNGGNGIVKVRHSLFDVLLED